MKSTHFVLVEMDKIKHALECTPSGGVSAINQYQCDHCKRLHSAEYAAELCCFPNCIQCNEPLPEIPAHSFSPKMCDSCKAIQKSQDECARASTCEVVKEPTTRFIYSPAFGGEGYLDLSDYEGTPFTLQEIVEQYCADRPMPLPAPFYVYDCDEETWRGLNIDSCIENELEEWFDGAADHLVGMDELVKAVKEFNLRQTLSQYHRADRIIILDEVSFQRYFRNEA